MYSGHYIKNQNNANIFIKITNQQNSYLKGDSRTMLVIIF